MAGTVTVSATNASLDCTGRTPYNIITIAWTCDASGDADANIASTWSNTLKYLKVDKVRGYINHITTDPSATSAPTDLYDITLTDDEDMDVVSGTLMNRSSASSETVTFDRPVWVDSELSLTVDNAGNAKAGEIKIYMTKTA